MTYEGLDAEAERARQLAYIAARLADPEIDPGDFALLKARRADILRPRNPGQT